MIQAHSYAAAIFAGVDKDQANALIGQGLRPCLFVFRIEILDFGSFSHQAVSTTLLASGVLEIRWVCH